MSEDMAITLSRSVAWLLWALRNGMNFYRVLLSWWRAASKNWLCARESKRMSETQRVVEVDPQSARRRNKQRMYWIGGIAVIGAAIVAAMFLVPSPDIIDGQLQRETDANRQAAAPAVTTRTQGGDAQVLVGTQGTTIIIGNSGKMIGTDVNVMDLVNARDTQGFPDVVLVRSAEVQTVPGDKVFSIGETPANSILVKIEEPTQPGNLSESALVMRPGQRVAVSGTLTKVGTLDELKRILGVTSYEAGKLGNTSMIIRAQTVQILQN
jgi:hypothetical protein